MTVFCLAFIAFVATARLFHGDWMVLMKHCGVSIGEYCAGLVVLFSLAYSFMFRRYLGLRETGGKLVRAEDDLRRAGWIED
jgi:hypothetical protein